MYQYFQAEYFQQSAPNRVFQAEYFQQRWLCLFPGGRNRPQFGWPSTSIRPTWREPPQFRSEYSWGINNQMIPTINRLRNRRYGSGGHNSGTKIVVNSNHSVPQIYHSSSVTSFIGWHSHCSRTTSKRFWTNWILRFWNIVDEMRMRKMIYKWSQFWPFWPFLTIFYQPNNFDVIFFQDHIQEVLDKWESIDDEIWAKVTFIWFIILLKNIGQRWHSKTLGKDDIQ